MKTQNRSFLLFGSLGLVSLMILVGVIAGRMLSSLAAVLTVGCIYWIGCWTLGYFGAEFTQLARNYRSPLSRKPIDLLMTWLPPLGVMSIAVLSSLPVPSAFFIAIVLGIAIVNGVTEEMFWRGAFVTAFPNQFGWGFIYPTVLFSVWHIALLCIPNVKYEAGALGMLGGAAGMGLLWGGVFWRTRDLRSVTIAHVVTNIFAFSMLATENWFES